MSYLEHTWTGDETSRLQRSNLGRRGVESSAQNFGSWPMGDGTSGDVLEDGDEVRSLTESVSGSDRKFEFEL